MIPEQVVPNAVYAYCAAADPGCETTMVVTLLSLIAGGCNEGQKALVEAAAHQCGVSATYAFNILQRYTGPSFGDYFWTFRRGSRGQRLYEVLPAN